MLFVRRFVVLAVLCYGSSAVSAAAPYAQLSSTETQMGGTAKVVTFNACDGASRLSSFGGAVGFPDGGNYFITAAGQIGGAGTGRVRLWLRLNGKDVENSSAEQSVIDGSTSVLISQSVISVKAGDKLTLVFSSTSPEIGLIATQEGAEPAIPSMIFSAFLVSQGEYAQLSSLKTQPCAPQAKGVILDQIDLASGIANRDGAITFERAGAYFVIAAGQVGGGGEGKAQLWLRKNGGDMDNTNAEQSLTPRATAVLGSQRVARMNAGDQLTLMHVGKGEGVALEASRPRREPAIPSLIFSAFRTGESFAQVSSLRTQPAEAKGRPIVLEQNDALSDVVNDHGLLTIKKSGVYFLLAAGQVGGDGAGGGEGSVRLWMRRNGEDVENSNTEQSVFGGSTSVLVCQGVMELEAGDTIQLMQSARGDGIGMVATPRGATPAVPSLILSLFSIQ